MKRKVISYSSENGVEKINPKTGGMFSSSYDFMDYSTCQTSKIQIFQADYFCRTFRILTKIDDDKIFKSENIDSFNTKNLKMIGTSLCSDDSRGSIYLTGGLAN